MVDRSPLHFLDIIITSPIVSDCPRFLDKHSLGNDHLTRNIPISPRTTPLERWRCGGASGCIRWRFWSGEFYQLSRSVDIIS